MYINLSVFSKSGLGLSDLVLLCAIKQTDEQFIVENLSDPAYERFKAASLITHIKSGKKSDHAYKSLRLSKQGKELISELEEAPVEEEDKKVGEWLINYYKQAGKEIGNKKKLIRHIKDFRLKSGIEKNNLIKLCLDFLRENEENSRVLEYIWYYPKTAFETRFDLNESWLYKHYLKNEERLIKTFEEY